MENHAVSKNQGMLESLLVEARKCETVPAQNLQKEQGLVNTLTLDFWSLGL